MWAALRAEGVRLAAAFRTVVVQALQAWPAGAVVLCVEHDLDPPDSRYPAMFAAMVQGVCTSGAVATGCRLAVVAATGADGADQAAVPHGLLGILHGMEARSRRGAVGLPVDPVVLPSVRFASPGPEEPGLVLADIVTHELGPHGNQDVPADTRLHAAWTLQALRQRVAMRLGPAVPVVVVDGLRSGELVGAVAAGVVPAASALRELEALRLPGALPRGALRAPLDHATTLLRHWEVVPS